MGLDDVLKNLFEQTDTPGKEGTLLGRIAEDIFGKDNPKVKTLIGFGDAGLEGLLKATISNTEPTDQTTTDYLELLKEIGIKQWDSLEQVLILQISMWVKKDDNKFFTGREREQRADDLTVAFAQLTLDELEARIKK